jgi:sodium/bile acid cotransporter 7
MTLFPRWKRLRPDGFVVAMTLTVILAALYPLPGTSSGPLHMNTLTAIGIALVFLLNGAGLSPKSLRAGAANWRLHLLVQFSTYGLFPLLGILIAALLHAVLTPELLTGVFFLCALSSTISTSIALTSLARGNVAGAVFNASLSSLLGMVITPVLVGLWQHTQGQGAPLGEEFLKIAEQLLLPFVLGQALRPWIGGWLHRNKAVTGKVDRGVILLIVYNSFCDSTAGGLWSRYGWLTLVEAAALAFALLGTALTLTTLAARRLGFNTEDEVAAVFCGSKKSLATGIPMARLLFGSGAALGLIVLPLMFYHQLQLFVGTYLAQRYARR